VDAAPIKRLVWDQSWQVEQFGVERDLAYAGVKPEGVDPLIGAIRDNLDHLNRLRGEVLMRSIPAPTNNAQPQGKSFNGIAGGIGLRPDGSLNIFIPGPLPRGGSKLDRRPGSWFMSVSITTLMADRRIPSIWIFVLGPEIEDFLFKEPPEWIRNGVFWKKV
jgi:hypothetical protein